MRYYAPSKLSENIRETPEGYLICVGVPIARTGQMDYADGETPLEVNDQGLVTIDRDEEEVFRPETIASFQGKPITITHPTEFVTKDNWNRLAKGTIQNARRGEGENKNDLIADLLITDSVAINLVKNGLREVSCGYDAEYIQTGKGQGKQKKILGNHLALVDEGRAGSSYAINDHKGKVKNMKLKDQIKAIFAKAQDEAMNLAQDAEPEKKDDAAPAKDAGAYDELVKMVKDLGEKISAMGAKPKDGTSPATENEPAKTVAKDDDVAAGLEDRLKALEAAVQKLLESKASAGDADADGDEDGESEDEDMEEESEDDDFGESTMVGDTASRIEILAPGLKAKGKDAKAKALKAAYDTQDGKKAIDALTGGKAPTFDSAEKVETLFIAASELLKVSRTSDLARTKQTRDSDFPSISSPGKMTAEKMNEINAKHYGKNLAN